jgi:uncharacterized LabA/DUF88 family protein
MKRAVFFVDGFNLYHAVKALKANHLKWLDLKMLCKNFSPSPQFTIETIYYFSAHATWLPDAYHRHKVYLQALKSTGVIPVLGKFKEKDRRCKQCQSMWKAHEEKETDVNIALHILDQAYQNKFDRAVIVSADSDFSPAIRLAKERFPEKQFRILTPVNRKHSWDLVNAVGGKENATHIKRIHIERSLFPDKIILSSGKEIVRPLEYSPPE